MKIEEEKKIAIFAGTTEGRLLAERLAGSNVRADVFVATEYGKEEIPEAPNLHVYDGRIDENGMEDLFREKRYDLILDATHPDYDEFEDDGPPWDEEDPYLGV